jgi:thiol-disulfide isomerase/thioredoxin
MIFFAVMMPFTGFSQEIREIDGDEIAILSRNSNDTTYVINFWATWCSPCVKEIDFFEEVHSSFQDSKVKVILVSLDFPNQVERRLIPFLEDKEITAQVMLMTDLDYNSWIERVDKSWSGAIPATLIFNRERRVFLEQELTRDELFENVNQILD